MLTLTFLLELCARSPNEYLLYSLLYDFSIDLQLRHDGEYTLTTHTSESSMCASNSASCDTCGGTGSCDEDDDDGDGGGRDVAMEHCGCCTVAALFPGGLALSGVRNDDEAAADRVEGSEGEDGGTKDGAPAIVVVLVRGEG